MFAVALFNVTTTGGDDLRHEEAKMAIGVENIVLN
jgi:hypothetical protein